MSKLGINHCSTGLMSVCRAADSIVDQVLCDFNPGNEISDCPHLRKDIGNHCDHPEAQWAIRYGSRTVVVKTLTKESMFDVRNNETYPEY